MPGAVARLAGLKYDRPLMNELAAELLERFLRHERRALAEIITRIEAGTTVVAPPRLAGSLHL